MVFEKIQEIFAEQLGIDPEDIMLTSDVANDLGADSLDVVEFMMAMEEEFGITIDDSEIVKFKTIGDIVRFIEKNT